MKIKSIHKEDAYYPYRKLLIGLELVKSGTHLSENPSKKGYMCGEAKTKNKVSVEGEAPSNQFFFLAVKVEE